MAQSVTIIFTPAQATRSCRIGGVLVNSNWDGAAVFFTVPDNKRLVVKCKQVSISAEGTDTAVFGAGGTPDEYSFVLGGGTKLKADGASGGVVTGFLEDDV